MNTWRKRFTVFAVCASGSLLASGCDVTQQILATVGAAWQIVDVWV